MKVTSLFLLTIFAAAAFAQSSTTWGKPTLLIGTATLGERAVEAWAEIEVTNTDYSPFLVIVVGRRFDGAEIVNREHRLAGAEKYVFKIEDEALRVPISADGHFDMDRFRASVLIYATKPSVRIQVRQFILAGNKLDTADLGSPEAVSESGHTYWVDDRQTGNWANAFFIFNTTSNAETAFICRGYATGCAGDSMPVFVSAFGTRMLHQPPAGSGNGIFVTVSKGVMAGPVWEAKGTSSTFEVNSGITFGPVK